MNPRLLRILLPAAAALSLLYLVAYVGIWRWTICRIEVPPGQSLLLRYKGPFPFGSARQAPADSLVRLDDKGRPTHAGILEAMPGPGRHYYSPYEYERTLVPDILIAPGKIGVVNAKIGKNLESGYLVDNVGDRGIWRRVLTPGRYRMNGYAYEVKVVDVAACISPETRDQQRSSGPAIITPGYVGVVTNKTDDRRTGRLQGIQDEVLQPGIYFINPEERQVDIISVGYNETTLQVETANVEPAKGADDASMMMTGGRMRSHGQGGNRGRRAGGEATAATEPTRVARDPVYVAGKGIEFPSNDGFPIHLDYTAIWGILPDQAPDVVRKFGNLKDVEQKVILPQIGSICRLHGSMRGAVDLLVGDSREEFQTDTSEELERVLASKNLSLLFGLTRHIYVPSQVREPIQKAKIADELKLTRDQEQLTAKAQADLTEAEAKVMLEERRTHAETDKLVAQLVAEGQKEAKEIEATTEKMKAEVDAKTAIIEAKSTTTLGRATAMNLELSNRAKAERYAQYVHSLGGAEAYNRYVFAEALAPDLRLGVFYAGPGTFWTDLKGLEQTLLGKLASQAERTAEPAADPIARPAGFVPR